MLAVAAWYWFAVAVVTALFAGYMTILYRAAERRVDRMMLASAAIVIAVALTIWFVAR